jgi:beta-fructofuranosidase/levanase
MNNWKYGGVIPTDPWRSAMSIPRELSLKTINKAVTLVQSPILETGEGNTRVWESVPAGTTKLNLTGKALDTTLTFTQAESTHFGIILRATADLSEQTRIGYDFTTEQVFVNRTHSGVVDFDGSFAGVYYAPLSSKNGTVALRILTDWSSVEVFGGQGEVSITAQIFPSDDADEAHLFSIDGATSNVELKTHQIESVW